MSASETLAGCFGCGYFNSVESYCPKIDCTIVNPEDTELCEHKNKLQDWDEMTAEECEEAWAKSVTHYLDNCLPCPSCNNLEGQPTCTNMVCNIRWGIRKLIIRFRSAYKEVKMDPCKCGNNVFHVSDEHAICSVCSFEVKES